MITHPEVLISQNTLQDRTAELGRQISQDYPATSQLVLIGVLRGALYFLADLSRQIPNDVEIEFIAVSSYNGTKSSGNVVLEKDIQGCIAGKDIIIVEDIVDTGRTLSALIQHFKHLGPSSIKTCALLDKPSRREISVPIHYRGFRIADHFVVGYGLDYNQAFRNLPFIGIFHSA